MNELSRRVKKLEDARKAKRKTTAFFWGQPTPAEIEKAETSGASVIFVGWLSGNEPGPGPIERASHIPEEKLRS